MKIEFDNNVPIYLQLLDYIKIYIITGQITCGSKLPSVRELANEFKVNPNTIQKALSELEDTGLIYTERTNGKFVTNDHKTIDNLKKSYANQVIKDFYQKMTDLGFSKSETINLLKEESEK